MKNNPSLVIVIFCIFSCFLDGSHGNRQGDALYKLFKAKFNGNLCIDIRLFQAMDLEKIVGAVDTKPDIGSKEADRIVRLPR